MRDEACCRGNLSRACTARDGAHPAEFRYRAPEVLLGSVHYSTGVDLWSTGCLLAELFLHRPVFPGQSTMHQVELLLQVCGVPVTEDIQSLASPYAATMLEAIPPVRPLSLPELLPHASAEATDFISQCLTFSPAKRWNVHNALRHPLVAEFHDPQDEPVRPCRAHRPDFSVSLKLFDH